MPNTTTPFVHCGIEWRVRKYKDESAQREIELCPKCRDRGTPKKGRKTKCTHS